MPVSVNVGLARMRLLLVPRCRRANVGGVNLGLCQVCALTENVPVHGHRLGIGFDPYGHASLRTHTGSARSLS